MNRLALSRAGSGLVRALVARGQGDRDRIFLTEIRSEDWQSLVFTGERHILSFRISGPDAAGVARALLEGLSDAEFELAGSIVADISASALVADEDGSVSVEIEALTVEE